MKNKKLAAIPLLIAIMLSVFGFTYAHWSDRITIEGTIHMGSLTVVWDAHEKGFLGYTDNEPADKDFAWANVTYDEDSYVVDDHTGKGGYRILIINITNAYPSYEVHILTLNINNTGTIPAHFVNITITGYDETDGEDLKFIWETGWEYKIGAFWDNGDNNVWDDPIGSVDDVEIINVKIVNFVCNQLDPCHNTKGEIDFHFKQDAEECHTYTYTVEIEAVQWNKA